MKNGAFVEYEEVYEGLSYGTLCSEVEKLWRDGRTPLFDVDVVGGQTLKAVFGDSALSIFVMPLRCSRWKTVYVAVGPKTKPRWRSGSPKLSNAGSGLSV